MPGKPSPRPADPRLQLRVLEACEQALERDDHEREAWLDVALGGEPELLHAVRRLLTRDAEAKLSLPTEAPEPKVLRPPVPPPERIGPFRLIGQIGEGGMGAVYRAERDDGLFDQTVAVKLISGHRMSAASEQRFVVERRALARLAHPNIARLIDGGSTAEGEPYLIMDHVDGAPITDWVRGCDAGDAAVAALIVQVCEAVSEAHRKLVVHGDIKPSNILITRPNGSGRSQALLLDFGVSRLMDIVDEEAARSPVTADYADPVRRRGEPPTVADDIYALGLVLRELTTRRGPQLGDSAPPRKASRDLLAIADRATAARAQDRYGSVDAMASDLRRWQAHEPVEARGGGTAYVAGRLLARRPRIVASAMLAVVALAATAAATTGLYLRAEAERREADRRFGQARAMARYMLFDLFDALNRTPGTIAIRRNLVDTSRRYLDDLSHASRASPELKADLAMGYLRLAGVLGMFGGGNLGERDRGRDMLRRAEQVLAEAPPGSAASAAWMHARGKLRLSQGFNVLNQGQGPGAARPLLVQAVDDLERAAALDALDGEILADLWEARLNLADVRRAENQPAAARALLEAELAAWPQRASAMTGNEKSPLLLANTHTMLGDVAYDLKQYQAAVDSYGRAAAVLEAEDRLHPGRPRTLFALVNDWWSIGGTLDELGQREAALAFYDHAVQAGRRGLAVDPDNDALRSATNVAALDRAGLLARLGRRAQALAEGSEPLRQARTAAEARPDDIVAVRRYLSDLRPFADLEAAVGRKAQACADYRRARAGWTAFEARFGIAPRIREGELRQLSDRLKACR